ncbi:MAG TPA: hypothetical protein DEO84_08025 [candidate division Zixibacteria bacterium]|jgi:hypothetical protein|nr:hypothetical protein [candidate division Zixibacteria bacterium]HBZ01248.1 hypothetical protein [candidate division Zixibacteria bacterium]
MKEIFISSILFIFSAISVFGQADTINVISDSIRTPVSTVYFAGYKAVNVSVGAKGEDNWHENEWEVYLCDRKLLTSFMWYPGPVFYDFNYNPNGGNQPRYIQDINNDGKGEIIFEVYSGGNNGWVSTFIYSMDTTATLIGDFKGIDTGLNMLRFNDIDDDSIPELIFNDMNYDCWPEGCAGAPAPLLIWKWTGKQYRLANLKFSQYLSNSMGWKDKIKSRLEDYILRPGYSPFPPVIAEIMLEYIYAGEYAAADSAFYALWPNNLGDKEKYHKEIWDYAKGSYFWPELQKSNW